MRRPLRHIVFMRFSENRKTRDIGVERGVIIIEMEHRMTFFHSCGTLLQRFAVRIASLRTARRSEIEFLVDGVFPGRDGGGT
jgi:hypothetical protein